MLKLCLLPRSSTAETTKPAGQLFPFGQVCAERAICAPGAALHPRLSPARTLPSLPAIPGSSRRGGAGSDGSCLCSEVRQTVLRKHNRCSLLQNSKRFTEQRLSFLPQRCVRIKGPRSVLALKLPFHINEGCSLYSPPRCLFSG